jgi:hypothetical protein
VLYWLLLGIGTITVDLPDAFAAGLTHIAAKMHADRRARDIHGLETARKKTFRDKHGERIAESLLLLAGDPDDDLLPPFYQELGGCQKGESERVILQREVDQSAEVLGVLPFKVTPSQRIALKTFVFCGLSVSEIGTRVLPFSTTTPYATSAVAVRATAGNHANAEIFDLTGDPCTGALSTDDTQRIRNQKGYTPTNWGEARIQIRCMLGLLGALCGDEHYVTHAWGTILRRYERVEERLQHSMDLKHGPRLSPGLFVFHLQLILCDWFENQTGTGQRFNVPAPDFTEHIRTFERQNYLNWLRQNTTTLVAKSVPPAELCLSRVKSNVKKVNHISPMFIQNTTLVECKLFRRRTHTPPATHDSLYRPTPSIHRLPRLIAILLPVSRHYLPCWCHPPTPGRQVPLTSLCQPWRHHRIPQSLP